MYRTVVAIRLYQVEPATPVPRWAEKIISKKSQERNNSAKKKVLNL